MYISSMTKTQIQVPEELLQRVKALAERKEWSLAETFRRGAELLIDTYPDEIPAASRKWQPPSSATVGWKGLSAEQLRDLAFEDQPGGMPRS